MKKYIPVDFDEKGNAVLGREKNTPTSNSFIPTTWAPGGDEGNGIKSVSVSPALAADPAIESFFPIYYDDLTEEEKQSGRMLNVFVDELDTSAQYTFTITPSSEWYALNTETMEHGGKGEPVSMTVQGGMLENGIALVAASENTEMPAEQVAAILTATVK